jgi:AcrR family transcriptional regulator
MKLKPARRGRRSYEQGARAEAAEENGRRIIDAFLSRLMNQWLDEITLDRVAEDAGVTVQTIIRRFGGKDGLLNAAAGVLGERINASRETPGGDVAAMIEKLYADYETTGDTVIRLLALEPRHPGIEEVANLGRREHRAWVEKTLEGQLAKLDASARQRALDSLVVATDVYTWKLLRRDMRRSVKESIATTQGMVCAILGSFRQGKAESQ